MHRAAYVRGGGLVHRDVTVADKDGGTGSDSKTLVVNAPPDVHVGDTGGNEGSAIPLVATVPTRRTTRSSTRGRRLRSRASPPAPSARSRTRCAEPVDHVQRQRRVDGHAHRERRRQPAGLVERDADGAERRAAPDADVLAGPQRSDRRDGERRDRRPWRDRHVRVHLRVGRRDADDDRRGDGSSCSAPHATRRTAATT